MNGNKEIKPFTVIIENKLTEFSSDTLIHDKNGLTIPAPEHNDSRILDYVVPYAEGMYSKFYQMFFMIWRGII